MGYRFFTEAHAGQLDQKLLLIRFDGTKFDNLLVTDCVTAPRTPDSVTRPLEPPTPAVGFVSLTIRAYESSLRYRF